MGTAVTLQNGACVFPFDKFQNGKCTDTVFRYINTGDTTSDMQNNNNFREGDKMTNKHAELNYFVIQSTSNSNLNGFFYKRN